MKTLINIAGWISWNRQWLLILVALICFFLKKDYVMEAMLFGTMLFGIIGEAYALYMTRTLKARLRIYAFQNKRHWGSILSFILLYAVVLVLCWNFRSIAFFILLLICFLLFGIVQLFRLRDDLYFIAFEGDTVHLAADVAFSISVPDIHDIRFGKGWYEFKWNRFRGYTINIESIREDQREAFRLALEEWVMKHEFAAEKK